MSRPDNGSHFDRVPFRDDEKSHILVGSQMCDLANVVFISGVFVNLRFSFSESSIVIFITDDIISEAPSLG